MIKKSFLILTLLIIIIISSGYTRPDVYIVDATKNATMHNNLGLNEVAEGNYFAAIQEFSIAIALCPRTQATAVYYNNLGETYMKVGYYADAQKCFENSIKQYNLNFKFYKNLVNAYKAQKNLNSKIKIYESKSLKNPLDKITLGLLYVAKGDVRRGIIKLDEFCMDEPDLLITDAVRKYIKEIMPKD